mgnify:CR=1 FL=1
MELDSMRAASEYGAKKKVEPIPDGYEKTNTSCSEKERIETLEH